LLMEANHTNTNVCRRGQCVRSYKDMQEGLKWYVGWRKHAYTKGQCETAMKWLKKATMITTKKTTRGMVITVCNYDRYQTARNYENHKANYKRTTREPQTSDTLLDKKDKKDKNDKNEYSAKFEDILRRYPNKDGKKAAQKHFNASVKTEQDWVDLNTALDNYLDHLDKKEWKSPKNCSTWFNNWRDWIDWEEPEKEDQNIEHTL